MATELKDRPRYIFLEEGDVIQHGDEYFYNNNSWDAAPLTYYELPVEGSEKGLYRRKVSE